MVRDITWNAFEMPADLLELAYWQARCWGMTEREIRHALVSVFALLAIVALPESRVGGQAMLLTASVRWIDRPLLWLFGRRWFMVIRKGMLLCTAVLSLFLLVMTPTTNSQNHDPFSLPSVVEKNSADIDKLKESVLEIKSDVKALRQDWDSFFWWLKGIGIATLTTLVGLNMTKLYTDAARGKVEREREAARVAAKFSTKPTLDD